MKWHPLTLQLPHQASSTYRGMERIVSGLEVTAFIMAVLNRRDYPHAFYVPWIVCLFIFWLGAFSKPNKRVRVLPRLFISSVLVNSAVCVRSVLDNFKPCRSMCSLWYAFVVKARAVRHSILC